MTTQSRRTWLDSLKPGDEVAVWADGSPNTIAKVGSVSAKAVHVEDSPFSRRTGRMLDSPYEVVVDIRPATDWTRRSLHRRDQARRVISSMDGMPDGLLDLFCVLLDWQHVPDVIVYAHDMVLGLIKERTEARQ